MQLIFGVTALGVISLLAGILLSILRKAPVVRRVFYTMATGAFFCLFIAGGAVLCAAKAMDKKILCLYFVLCGGVVLTTFLLLWRKKKEN